MFLEWIAQPLKLLEVDKSSNVLGRFPLASKRILVQEVTAVLLSSVNATINQSSPATTSSSPSATNAATSTSVSIAGNNSQAAMIPNTTTAANASATSTAVAANVPSIHDLLATESHLLWFMEVLSQGFTLPMEDNTIISQTCIIYSQWLLDSQLRPRLIAQDPQQLLWQRMFKHLSLVFMHRKTDWKAPNASALLGKHVELCRGVLKTLVGACRAMEKQFLLETWKILLSVILGICDYILHDTSVASSGAATTPPLSLASELSSPCLRALLEIWLRSGVRDAFLWLTFTKCFRQWATHRVDVVSCWNNVTLALTKRVLNDMFSPSLGSVLPLTLHNSAAVNIPMSPESAVYYWHRFLALIDSFKALLPTSRMVAVEGIGHLVESCLVTSEQLYEISPHTESEMQLQLVNGNTILSLFGERIFEAIFVDNSSNLSETEVAKSEAMRIMCRIFCQHQFREPWDKYFVAKFLLAVKKGALQALNELSRGERKANWGDIEFKFACSIIHGVSDIFTTIHSVARKSNNVLLYGDGGQLRGIRTLLPELFFLVHEMIASFGPSDAGINRRRSANGDSFALPESLQSVGIKLLGTILAQMHYSHNIPLAEELLFLNYFPDYSIKTVVDLKALISDFLISCITDCWSDNNFASLLRVCSRYTSQELANQPYLSFRFLDAIVNLIFQTDTDRNSSSDGGSSKLRSSWQFLLELNDLFVLVNWREEDVEIVKKAVLAISHFLDYSLSRFRGECGALSNFFHEGSIDGGDDSVEQLKNLLPSHLDHHIAFLERDPFEYLWKKSPYAITQRNVAMNSSLKAHYSNVEFGLKILCKLGVLFFTKGFVCDEVLRQISQTLVRAHVFSREPVEVEAKSSAAKQKRSEQKTKLQLGRSESSALHPVLSTLALTSEWLIHNVFEAISLSEKSRYFPPMGYQTGWEEEKGLDNLSTWLASKSPHEYHDQASRCHNEENDEHLSLISYFAFEDRSLVGLFDCPGENDDTSLVIIVRDGTGRQCWKLAFDPRNEVLADSARVSVVAHSQYKDELKPFTTESGSAQENTSTHSLDHERRPSSATTGNNRFKLVSAPLLGSVGGLIDASRLKPRFPRSESDIGYDDVFFSQDEENHMRLPKTFTAIGAYHEVVPAVEQQAFRLQEYRQVEQRPNLCFDSVELKYVNTVQKAVDMDRLPRFRLGRLLLSQVGFLDPGVRSRLMPMDSLAVQKGIRMVDHLPERECISVSVLYASSGVVSIEELLGVGGSLCLPKDFQQFCLSLGEIVDAESSNGWRGGYERVLASSNAKASKSSLNLSEHAIPIPYWSDMETELIYHVPYLLEAENVLSETDGSMLAALKSLIADDLVYVIWADELYGMDTIPDKIFRGLNEQLLVLGHIADPTSSLLCVPEQLARAGIATGGLFYLVIHPLVDLNDHYLVKIFERKILGIEGDIDYPVGPLENNVIVPRSCLSLLVRQTIMNAHRNALRQMFLAKRPVPVTGTSGRLSSESPSSTTCFFQNPCSFYPHPHFHFERPYEIRQAFLQGIARRSNVQSADDFSSFYSFSFR